MDRPLLAALALLFCPGLSYGAHDQAGHGGGTHALTQGTEQEGGQPGTPQDFSQWSSDWRAQWQGLMRDPNRAKKAWEGIHGELHAFMSADHGDPKIGAMCGYVDSKIEEYQKERLAGSAGKDGAARARDYMELIRVARQTQRLMDVAVQAAPIHKRLSNAGEVKPEERPKLERDLAALADKSDKILDFMGGNEPTKEFHGRIMNGERGDITDYLSGIGLKHSMGHIEGGEGSGGMANIPHSGAQNAVGRSRFEKGDYAGAEDAYGKAIAMDGGNLTALAGRGAARFNQGDYQGAYADAKAALAIDPGNASAKGTLQFAAGRLGPDLTAPKASDPWSSDEAARLDRRGAAPLRGAEGASPEARESAQHAAEAARQFQLGDLSAARRSLNRALEVNPANADAHAKRGWLNAAQGNMADAVADLRSVLKLDRKNGPGAVSKLAGELNKRGRYLDAKSILELISPEDRDARAWYNLAAAENGLGDRDAMMAALRKAAQLDPASYGGKLERALSAAPDEDLGFLFDQVKADVSRRDGGRGHGGDGAGRLLMTVLSVLIGGFLVALGLLHSLVPQVTRQWTTRIRSAFAGGPGVAVAPDDAAQAAEPAAGTNRLGGNYELVRQIGLGGMGIVYEGLDTALGRRVAVKKMREEIRVDPRERERFISEARTVAKLKHPGIVEIHSIVEEGDDVFLIFEYVDGSTLYELLDRKGRLPLADALRIAQQAGDALAFAHGRDIIHRDLKPSNIMLTEGGTVKVMDFGVARQAKDAVSKLSMTNTIVGTPPYMAPEQEQGLVCKESDVYALAICFYELVTGRLPFQGTGAGMLLNKMNKSYAPPSTLAPDLPASLDAVMAKAFEPDPARRYRTVAEFLAALKPIAAI